MSNKWRKKGSADAHFFVYTPGSVLPRDITHVLVHHSVEVLPARVFRRCRYLKEVKIQEGLREIGASAFCECGSLEHVILPSTLVKIGQESFSCCTSLCELAFPEGLIEIDDGAFQGCSSLERYRVPSTVTTIGVYAFCKCTSLKVLRLCALNDIMLPATLTAIGKTTFTLCSWGEDSFTLRRVILSGGILAVGAEAFSGNLFLAIDIVISSKAFVIAKRGIDNYSFQFLTNGTIPETDSAQVVIASEGFNSLRPTEMPGVERAIARILGPRMLLGWSEKRERLRALVAPYEMRYNRERAASLELGLCKAKVDANGAAFIVPQVLSFLWSS